MAGVRLDLEAFLMFKVKGLLNNNSRLLLFLVVLAGVAYLIVRNIAAFGNVVVVVIGFGAVVLVHEFGHFIVAKLSGIRVEVFSIGISPILAGIKRTEEGFRFRILPGILETKEGDESDGSMVTFTIGKKGKAGETEYRIGLIPFGGFVKMLGQDDTKTVEASDDPRSYANKPVGIRMAVISAGVVFNAISAIIVFMVVFLIGIHLMPPVVGGVVPDSPAAMAGLRAGDEIIEIAGNSYNLDFTNIGVVAALSGKDEKVSLKVEHEDGTVEEVAMVAEQLEGISMPMRMFGVLPPQSLVIDKVSDAKNLLEKTGLAAGDRIKSVDGIAVQTYWELEKIVRSAVVPEVTVLSERSKEDGRIELVESKLKLDFATADRDVKSEADLNHIYSMVPRLRISSVMDGIVLADKGSGASLQSGDIIVAVGDIDNPTYKELRDLTEEYEGKKLAIKVLRSGADGSEKIFTVGVVPKKSGDSDRVVIGITVVLDAAHAVVAKTIGVEGGKLKLEIPRGAVITAVDGTAVSSFYDCLNQIRKSAGQRVMIDYRVNEEIAGDVALNAGTDDSLVSVKSVFSEFIPFKPLERLYKANGPGDAIRMGYKKTVMFIAQAYVTLQRFVSGLVSPKNFMGPVGIVTLSYKIVSERPLVYYVYFLGLISAFIAVFNFLPMLPFDGGHIVFLLVEKIKGSAVSEKVQGIVTYVGLTVVGVFALYVTFNDIVRSFFSK